MNRKGAPKLSQEQVEKMRRLRREGLTYKQIALRFGVSAGTAHRACNPPEVSNDG